MQHCCHERPRNTQLPMHVHLHGSTRTKPQQTKRPLIILWPFRYVRVPRQRFAAMAGWRPCRGAPRPYRRHGAAARSCPASRQPETTYSRLLVVGSDRANATFGRTCALQRRNCLSERRSLRSWARGGRRRIPSPIARPVRHFTTPVIPRYTVVRWGNTILLPARHGDLAVSVRPTVLPSAHAPAIRSGLYVTALFCHSCCPMISSVSALNSFASGGTTSRLYVRSCSVGCFAPRML
jgi:hypothetical protein